MKKRRTSRHLKEAPKAPTVSVQVPLPMLLSLEMARQSFLDVCISAGLEVLARGMEEDRTALCVGQGLTRQRAAGHPLGEDFERGHPRRSSDPDLAATRAWSRGR